MTMVCVLKRTELTRKCMIALGTESSRFFLTISKYEISSDRMISVSSCSREVAGCGFGCVMDMLAMLLTKPFPFCFGCC